MQKHSLIFFLPAYYNYIAPYYAYTAKRYQTISGTGWSFQKRYTTFPTLYNAYTKIDDFFTARYTYWYKYWNSGWQYKYVYYGYNYYVKTSYSTRGINTYRTMLFQWTESYVGETTSIGIEHDVFNLHNNYITLGFYYSGWSSSAAKYAGSSYSVALYSTISKNCPAAEISAYYAYNPPVYQYTPAIQYTELNYYYTIL